MTATDDLELAAEADRIRRAIAQVAAVFHIFPLDHPALPYCAGIKTREHDPRTCNERGKHPTCRWSEWSTQDPVKLNATHYFGGLRPLNIGIDCGKSEILVVDEDAEGEWERLCADLGVEPPETFTSRTAQGRHIYFRQPPGAPLGNQEGALRGYKLNVRGVGGYVVGPGSLHATGVIYKVSVLAEVAAAPDWLIDALRTRPSSNGQHDVLASADERLWWLEGTIGEGDRHNAMVAAAGWALRMGLRLGEARPYVRDVWSRCEGGKYTWDQAVGRLEDVYGRYEAGDRLSERRNGNGAAPAVLATSNGAAPSVTLNELLDGDEPTYDWLVPGLIERGDRVIISGDEGWGKSTWLRQIGLGAAAGHNPFALDPLEADHAPLTVVAVDCENSSRQLRREYPKARRAIDFTELTATGDRYHLAVRTEGLVLDKPNDPTDDRAWLQDEIANHRPAILFLGPLYKLMGGDPSDEVDSRLLALYLDRLRGINAHTAIVIEAHAPHNQKRPYGWSGWKRWPEFGLHLSSDGTLTPFRGGRDDSRHWPRQLRRGRDGEWPWMPTDRPAAPPRDLEDEYDARVRQAAQRLLDTHRDTWLSQAEIIDRVPRRKNAVKAAICHFRDNGWLLTATEERPHGAVMQPTEVYRLDPDGPAGDHDA